MKTSQKSHIVVQIPAPVGIQIAEIRKALGYKNNLPIDLTLTGSSGVGPIPVGTDLALIKDQIDQIANQFTPFEVIFNECKIFSNTSIAYLSPSDRTIFDRIHESLKQSSIPFLPSEFEYTPHCTVTTNLQISIEKITIPNEKFIIDSISLFERNDITSEITLLYKTKLKPEPND
ncbi:MAG: 2'-5' RNA ligase family protein [Kiritimatiellae bacterium]|jgi:2'-5' RNA ligase|nr:2'-5' RNA ligase family protein [Kiritimatiellia bacterium]